MGYTFRERTRRATQKLKSKFRSVRNRTAKTLRPLKRKFENLMYKVQRQLVSKKTREGKLLSRRFQTLKKRYMENNPNWEQKNNEARAARLLAKTLKIPARSLNELGLINVRPPLTKNQVIRRLGIRTANTPGWMKTMIKERVTANANKKKQIVPYSKTLKINNSLISAFMKRQAAVSRKTKNPDIEYPNKKYILSKKEKKSLAAFKNIIGNN